MANRATDGSQTQRCVRTSIAIPLIGLISDRFPTLQLNTCFNAVDRHVLAGNGQRDAIIYDSALTGRKERISYQQLLHKVATLAAVLQEQGVKKGDTVVIYMVRFSPNNITIMALD